MRSIDRAKLALILPGVLLAGCGADEAGNEGPVENAPTTNYQAAVAQLSPGQRNGVMIRAIRDAGLECQGVSGSQPLGDRPGTWRARCSDGREHLIQIAPDGNARVISGAGAP